MARKPITLAGRAFPTKDSLVLEIRRILHGTLLETCLDGKDDVLMRAVFELYPPKVAPGIKHISVRQSIHPQARQGEPGFFIKRIDGTQTDIGYKATLDRETKGFGWRKITAAFRVAVQDQTCAIRDDAFASNATLICPVLNIEFNAQSCAVDHIAPDTFNTLLIRFGVQEGLNEDGWAATITASRDMGAVREIADVALRMRWRAFHAQYAKLRVISSHANQLIGVRGTLPTSAKGA